MFRNFFRICGGVEWGKFGGPSSQGPCGQNPSNLRIGKTEAISTDSTGGERHKNRMKPMTFSFLFHFSLTNLLQAWSASSFRSPLQLLVIFFAGGSSEKLWAKVARTCCMSKQGNLYPQSSVDQTKRVGLYVKNDPMESLDSRLRILRGIWPTWTFRVQCCY